MSWGRMSGFPTGLSLILWLKQTLSTMYFLRPSGHLRLQSGLASVAGGGGREGDHIGGIAAAGGTAGGVSAGGC